MDYLPNNATIDEACEWLQYQTGQKWTLPRLLEDGHLTPYVWIDYIPGMPQISGDRREGYLTMMVYHGDVMRLAADRNEALLTMFTAHDGTPVRTEPGWRVELKDIRFKKEALERVAEIINNTAPAQNTTPPAPVVAVGDGLAPLTTAPSWSLITPPERTPGYRWPLYQFLREAHVAGKPCPKAQEVLDAWKLNPPSGLKVIQSGRCDALEYELVHGGKKIADLRAIQAAINDLVIRIDRTAAK